MTSQQLWVSKFLCLKKKKSRDFPGGPVVKTPRFQCRGHWFDPGQGTKIPYAVPCSQNNKKIPNGESTETLVMLDSVGPQIQ